VSEELIQLGAWIKTLKRKIPGAEPDWNNIRRLETDVKRHEVNQSLKALRGEGGSLAEG